MNTMQLWILLIVMIVVAFIAVAIVVQRLTKPIQMVDEHVTRLESTITKYVEQHVNDPKEASL